jgi:CRISPR-associated exonuclease Cas4
VTFDSTDGLEDEAVYVPISALEHYSYCPRQCALIHVEQTFEENLFTIKGQIAHERVDTAGDSVTRGIKVARAVPLWSERLGLQGKADLVEFRGDGPYPVEYKLGRRRGIHADLQLCAQALCLEEMLGVEVARGAIFYHGMHRRHEVMIDEPLRQATLRAIEAVREMLGSQRLPAAPNDARCSSCSLLNACMPSVIGEPARVRGLQGALFRALVLGREADDADA